MNIHRKRPWWRKPLIREVAMFITCTATFCITVATTYLIIVKQIFNWWGKSILVLNLAMGALCLVVIGILLVNWVEDFYLRRS